MLLPTQIAARVLSPIWLTVFLCTFVCETRAVEGKIQAVVSIEPQLYFLREIAGDLVQGRSLIPRSANPHMYEPALDSFIALEKVQVFFAVGHPKLTYEAQWIEKAKSLNPKLVIVNASSGASIDGDDPHVWLIPPHVRVIARNIARALTEIDARHADVFAANLARFERKVDAVDSSVRSEILASAGKTFLVLHPAWGYFAKEYGLTQLSVEREGKEPDAGSLASIISEAKRRKIKVLFLEPQISDSSATAILQEIGGRAVVLDPMLDDWSLNILNTAKKIAEGAA